MHKQGLDILSEADQKGTPAAVTVAVGLWNQERYIVECLESVSSQTLDDLELIVIDDCSTDGSLEAVQQWINKRRIRFRRYLVARHTRKSGLAAVRNSGLANTRTSYVFPAAGDNLIYPRCLSQLLSALEQCRASFAYCYLQSIGDINGLKNTRPWNPSAFQYGSEIDPMVLHRKSMLDKVGGYSTDISAMGLEDFDLWFKIARNHGWGIMVPEILASYRVHDQSIRVKTTYPNANKSWTYLKKKYPEFFTGRVPFYKSKDSAELGPV